MKFKAWNKAVTRVEGAPAFAIIVSLSGGLQIGLVIWRRMFTIGVSRV